MKVNFSKGFNAVGLLLLTFQILVCLFEYIVNTEDVALFFVNTWAGLIGFLLMIVLFVKNRLGEDFILTLIGALLWVAQFVQIFRGFNNQYLSAFLYCSVGILGVAFILVGLIVNTVKNKKENKK